MSESHTTREPELGRPDFAENAKVEGKPEYLLQFFDYAHLPDHLREVSKEFSLLAHRITTMLPRNPERTVALRKLLEAKDCAVRARLFKP
jgi:hypothetical protein